MSGVMQRLFSSMQQQQQQQPQQQQQQQTQVAAAGNPAVPTGISQPVPGQENNKAANPGDAAASPMDGFKDLWKTPDSNNNNGQQQPQADLDPTKLQEVVAKANFTSAISPELMQKALAGDHAAFAQAMNSVAQQVFMQSLMASNKLTEQSVNSRFDSHTKELPNLIKRNLVSESLADNPLYKHEATKPIITALEAQFTQQFPQATAAQISEYTKQYLKEFASVVVGNDPSKQQQTQQKQNPAEDWDAF